MNAPLLQIDKVNKHFGGVAALTDVSLSIQPGEIYGLIGPNGAGKTTFFNVMTGLYTPDSGRFQLDGRDYQPTSVHQVAEAGIARTFQNIRLFNAMSALENVMVGRHVRTRNGLWAALSQHRRAREEEAQTRAHAHRLLAYVGLVTPITAPTASVTATSVAWKSPAPWPPNLACWRWTNPLPA